MTTVRLPQKGAWIDATYDGTALTLAAVGSPLQYLVKTPTSIPARHKQSEERGRLAASRGRGAAGGRRRGRHRRRGRRLDLSRGLTATGMPRVSDRTCGSAAPKGHDRPTARA